MMNFSNTKVQSWGVRKPVHIIRNVESEYFISYASKLSLTTIKQIYLHVILTTIIKLLHIITDKSWMFS